MKTVFIELYSPPSMTNNGKEIETLNDRFGFDNDESKRLLDWLKEINEDSNIVLNKQKVQQFRDWHSKYIQTYYIDCCYNENIDMHIGMLQKIGYYDYD